jgi:hypothetical protein
MLSTAQFGSDILAPILAALLLNIIGIGGILTIDIATFLVAISVLLFVFIPSPIVTEEGLRSKGSLWKESSYGFRYIFARSSLLGLLLVFFCINLVITFAITVVSPMILSRTGNDTTILGIIQSATGFGGITGSIFLSLWGGPKRKIQGVFMGLILGMLGTLLFGLGQEVLLWSSAAFISLFFFPILNGSSQAIWKAKVAPDLQGRVFATRSLIAQISVPIAMVLAGPLADYYFEPSMMSGGVLVEVFGNLVGSGPGAGMSLMFVIAGILGMLIGFIGYAFHSIRNVEDVLPDYKTEVILPVKD